MKKLLFPLELTAVTDPKYRFIFDQLIELFRKHIQRFLFLNLAITHFHKYFVFQ